MKPIDPRQPLDCASARRLIDAFLLDELPADAGQALRDHLGGCVACTTELGGATRLMQLLGSLPVAAPAPDLDQRLILAALADRRRRHEHHSWLSDLRVQVFRGAMRTTGTLVLTIVTVAMLGGAFVFAASQLFPGLPVFVGIATVPTQATPTHERTAAPTTAPSTVSPTAPVVVAPTPEPTPAPTPAPAATPAAASTAAATLAPTPEPTATPTPTPTDKRRTPPPSTSPSPSPTAIPSDTAAPAATPTPSP